MHPYHFEPPGEPPPADASDDSGLGSKIEALGRELDLSHEAVAQLLVAHRPLCRWIDARRRAHGKALVVGVHGAQGSGKTTFCRFARVLLEQRYGWRVCGFSIDDLYLRLEERCALARDLHPLFATRGVPGTHDVAMGLDLLARLIRARDADEIAIPSFDKARDDRAPRSAWPIHRGRADIVIFEGWCVGCRPQGEAALEAPINTLEAEEDREGTWRRHVNHQLATDYAELFAQLDVFIVLEVPGFEQVRRWRSLQEEKLARHHPDAPALLDAEALGRFLMHYERITRHALATLPTLADVVCRIDDGHRIVRIDSEEPLVDG